MEKQFNSKKSTTNDKPFHLLEKMIELICDMKTEIWIGVCIWTFYKIAKKLELRWNWWLLIKWRKTRQKLKSKLLTVNTEKWQLQEQVERLRVGGVDISFFKDDDTKACAAYVIVDFNDDQQNVVYSDLQIVDLKIPYIPGYLAFREAEPLKDLILKQKNNHPELTPQVIMVDGNGILHEENMGHASHLGVLVDLPTIGVAKKLYNMDELGIVSDQDHKEKIRKLEKVGDNFSIGSRANGEALGVAVKTSSRSTKPVFVSVGHKIDLKLAMKIVLRCSNFRIPEPIRQADLKSRDLIRSKSTN